MTVEPITPAQKRLLAVLALLNLINYMDRQVLYPLFPLIQAEFHVSYVRLGLLAAAFSIVHSLGALVLGQVADRTSRKKVISFGVIFWSCATFLSGLAGSFRALLGARALVGVGEAAYTPAATAIISGTFSQRIRARVQGIFDMGMFLGGSVGVAMGGLLGDRVGWRPAFFIVGVPGLLLALYLRRLPEPPRGKKEELVPIRDLLRVPAYVAVLAGGWFLTFTAHAFIAWGPTFVSQAKGYSLGKTSLSLGGTLAAAGLLGVLAGAAIADRLYRRFPFGRALTTAIGFLISVPLIYGAIHAPNLGTLLAFLFGGVFFMSWYHGPVTAIIHDLIPPRAHATAMGFYYFFVNLFATVPAFLLVGEIADRSSLFTGMHVAVASQLCGGLVFAGVVALIRRHGLHHPAMAKYRRTETAEKTSGMPEGTYAPAARGGTGRGSPTE